MSNRIFATGQPRARRFRTALALASSLAVIAVSAPTQAAAPERFNLGTNSNGDSCSASRQWTAGDGTVRYASDQAFVINCRDIAAADVQGYVSAAGKPVPLEHCGDPLAATIAGIGPAEVRRCVDSTLNKPAIDIRFTRGSTVWQGAALESAAGALEGTLRVVAAGAGEPGARAIAKPSFDLAAVPVGPAFASVGETKALTAEAALADGISALQTGRLLDASRTLNDALRAFANADVSTRIDLRLAAGLAESNLSQFELAANDFAIADSLLRGAPDLPRRDQQVQKLTIYRGIDQISQNHWAEAIAVLVRSQAEVGSLEDPVTLSSLNEEATHSEDNVQAGLSDQNQLERSLLEAQRYRALSVAYLGANRIDEAQAALENAARAARLVDARYASDNIVWLRTMIERQQARIFVRRGTPGSIDKALVHLDCAVGSLSGSLAGGGCLFPGARPVSDTFQNAPLLADTRLERASIASRDPTIPLDKVLANYRSAVQTLPELTGTGYVSLAALERYFALLAKAPENADRDEEFFHTMQMIGEPAIAREYAQLQKVVAADTAVSGMLRRRALLDRQMVRLRTEISNLGAASGPDFDRLEQERRATDSERDALNGQLLSSDGIGALQDEPATVAEIRAALGPDEAYLKLAQLYSTMAGIVITKDKTWIYMVDGGLVKTEKLAEEVLTSARLNEETQSTRLFQVAKASQLFQAITGPAAPAVAAAHRVVYDPAGKLRQLPLAILVTDPASAQDYAKQKAKGDYSKLKFLARGTDTAVALSPRAFLRIRNDVKPSQAPGKFLGLGENAPAERVSAAAEQDKMPFDCSVSYGAWANVLAQNKPISARELGLAAAALGAPGSPEITLGAFTDVNLLSGPASTELGRYQVIHFATHGLPETQVDLPACKVHLPPALVTTLAAPSADGSVLSDGLLSFDEVARLQLDANLVVLSACDTAAGTSSQTALKAGLENASPALDGLVRSFIAARARAVMATFWAVPDSQETQNLMQTFYTTGRTAPMGNSLKVAQNQLLDTRRYSHPYYWGAYFLVGDGAKTMLTQPGQMAMK
jgi:CHAT domain-containing protein